VVGRTLASAFLPDPIFGWCIPDPERRAAILPPLFELFASLVLPHESSELAANGAAAALWVPAGQPPVADEDAAAFEAALVDLIGDDMDRTGAIMALLDEHHPTEPNHFLWFIGVDAPAQGRGLGSALLASALARCDQDGVPAYLDATSEHNRRLYERHGFAVQAERSTGGSPPLYAMWRQPRPPGVRPSRH